MNNKKGMVLVLSLIILMVLFIIYGVFSNKTINESRLVTRDVNSAKAFWAAEAGLAEAIKNLPNDVSITEISTGCTYQADTSFRATINFSNYYDVVATGTVTMPTGTIIRRIAAVVKTGPVDPSKFQFGIQAANDLCFGGACKKPAEDYLDPDVCNGHACWVENDASINFQDMFSYTQAEVSAIATHYTEATFPADLGEGIFWVDVSAGEELRMTGNGTGSGILIINGDASFGAGTYQFDGIVYVLGTLDLRGTFDAYGSTIVASSAGVDEINGSPLLHWDVSAITDALQLLSNAMTKTVVSWNEI